MDILNIWGTGQLFCFSGIDGRNDVYGQLILRSLETPAAFEIVYPETEAKIVLSKDVPVKTMLGCDFFETTFSDGRVIRGAMADNTHLLVEGKIDWIGSRKKVNFVSVGNLTLIGMSGNLDANYLNMDFECIFKARQAWMNNRFYSKNWSRERTSAVSKAYSQMKSQIYSPQRRIKHYWSTPDRWPHRDMWLWDSVFHAIGWRHVDVQIAEEILIALFDMQSDDGFVGLRCHPEAVYQMTQPSIIAYGAMKVFEISGNKKWLRKIYDGNKKYLNWVMTHRDTDGAGLVEWYIEETDYCRSGESGMDNSSRFDKALLMDAPDFNAYLSCDCEQMSKMAEILEQDEVQFWHKHHVRINQLINERLWNEKLCNYIDYEITNGSQSQVSSSAGFLPLLCGAPSEDQAKLLVENLIDPQSFGTPLPIPSISTAQSEFYQKDMWRGPVWVNINYMICDGLRRYKYDELADYITSKTISEIEKFQQKYGVFFEFYDDQQKLEPPFLLRKRKNDPNHPLYHPFRDYGWTATLYIDMVLTNHRRETDTLATLKKGMEDDKEF